MKRILVVANETVAGRPLIDAVKRRAEGEDVQVHVICPQNQPKHGYVIYDEHVRDAAENRLEMTLALLHEAGIEADGEIDGPGSLLGRDGRARRAGLRRDRRLDPPRDALRLAAPGARGPARARHAPRVEHVVVDLDTERDDVKRTLVVANQTVGGSELLERLKARWRPRSRGASS